MTQSIKAEDKLNFVIDLLTSLDNIIFEGDSNSVSGYITHRTDKSFDCLQILLENLGIDTSDNDKKSGKIFVPLTGTNIFYDLNHYLKKDSRRLDVSPSKSFYIYDQSIRYVPHTSSVSVELNNIFIIADLFLNLKIISDLQGNSGNKSFIIFVGKKNLKINSLYDHNDLSLDLVLIKMFIRDYIQNDFHKEDRHLSIINGLHEVYNEGEISLSDFLKKLKTFHRIVKSNFQLYMDNFSFEDFKNKIEEDRREYTIKINQVFSDIQNQLLTLPIATVLAASQMVGVSSAGDFIKNILIVIGIVIFCVFVLMQISNQNSTLCALGDELKLRSSEMYKKDESDHRTQYLCVYNELGVRIVKLGDNLALVKNITLVATSLVFFVFIARFFL